jgi:mono/diheme cytochrome c family protein
MIGMSTRGLAGLCVLVASTACSWPGKALRGYAEADADGLDALQAGGVFANAPRALHGQVRFVFDGFGSLTTDELDSYAMAWKLSAAALVRSRHELTGEPIAPSTLSAAMAEHGFVTPRRIANWEGPQPRLDRPLGVVSGTARRGFPPIEIEVANLGCATCHAAPLYGADGVPTGDAWLGLPNASLDLSAYADAVLAALTRELRRPDTLLATVRSLYPETSERELSTLRKHVIPGAREELARRADAYGGLLPFENGGPGLMNGVGSLRFLIGVLAHDARPTEIAWTSPPELSGTSLRRSLLIDGVYAPPGSGRYGPMSHNEVTAEHLDGLAGVASLFVAGTQGIAPAAARRQVPAVRDVMELVHEMRPPRFPGRIDVALAERGRELFARACASCHGTYGDNLDHPRLLTHPNRPVPQDRMLTDPVRWSTVDSTSLRLMGEIGYDGLIEAAAPTGYVAPDLSGVWATAPYLHNGSVPTLWHLLNAEERPSRFWVGGHALDYEKVGIAGDVREDGTYAYPSGYRPWSRPMIYDTSEPGRSNAGHEFRTLSEAEKQALLEYMKVL